MESVENEGLFVFLDHEDLINLVICSGPDSEFEMQALVEKGLGVWTGEFNDEFMWKYHELNSLDNKNLYLLYLSFKIIAKD